jgi:hypothetical protein
MEIRLTYENFLVSIQMKIYDFFPKINHKFILLAQASELYYCRELYYFKLLELGKLIVNLKYLIDLNFSVLNLLLTLKNDD